MEEEEEKEEVSGEGCPSDAQRLASNLVRRETKEGSDMDGTT